MNLYDTVKVALPQFAFARRLIFRARILNRKHEQAVGRSPVAPPASPRDPPVLVDLPEFIEVIAGVVGADIAPGNPTGAHFGSLGASQFDPRGPEVMPHEGSPRGRYPAPARAARRDIGLDCLHDFPEAFECLREFIHLDDRERRCAHHALHLCHGILHDHRVPLRRKPTLSAKPLWMVGQATGSAGP
jgi:hypothetical protein